MVHGHSNEVELALESRVFRPCLKTTFSYPTTTTIKSHRDRGPSKFLAAGVWCSDYTTEFTTTPGLPSVFVFSQPYKKQLLTFVKIENAGERQWVDMNSVVTLVNEPPTHTW